MLLGGALTAALPARAVDTITTGAVGSGSTTIWPIYIGIRNGFFEVSPLERLAGGPGFPTTPYKSSQVIVRGNFNLPAPGILRFHVFDHEKTATVNVKRAAVFAGTLEAAVEFQSGR